MPELHRYNLFIGHAWTYAYEYYRIIEFLDSAPYFYYSNYSVPEHDPLHSHDIDELENQLRQQIRPAEVVIVLAGMYVAYSDWIQFEIDYSLSLAKPILGVLPWASQRVPAAVSSAADELVGWNTNSIVSAIRRLG